MAVKNKRLEQMTKTLNQIDGALVAINAYPSLEDGVMDVAQRYGLKYLSKWYPTPLDFQKEILEHIVGSDKLLEIISDFLVYELPAVEAAVKASLLANMASITENCEIDPMIWENTIKNGVVFNINQIDLYDKLKVSPLDKKFGSCYYFGVEGLNDAYDILRRTTEYDSDYDNRDFDALLWYMINKSSRRQVWKKTTSDTESEMESKIDGGEAKKYTKDYGVLTLEYNPYSENVTNSEGYPMHQQVPYGDSLHVFLGNVKGVCKDTDDTEETISNYNSYVNGDIISPNLDEMITTLKDAYVSVNKKVENFVKKANTSGVARTKAQSSADYYKEIRTKIGQIIENVNSNELTAEAAIEKCSKISEELKSVNVEELDSDSLDVILASLDGYGLEQLKKIIKSEVVSLENTVFAAINSNSGVTYPKAERNYYFKKTLFQWNYDYIMSLKLFDSKVLAAQIISSLSGSLAVNLTLGLTASWKTEYIRDTVTKMVEKTIAAESFEVSDCFYTFSNDAVNNMLDAADLRQAGLYSVNGEQNSSTYDPTSALEMLNSLSSSAGKQEYKSTIEGALLEAAGSITTDTYSSSTTVQLNSKLALKVSFLEHILTQLCTDMVLAILSPKVYLMILINLELFGLPGNYSLDAFIERYKNIISQLVKSCVDQLLNIILNKIMEFIEDIATKLAQKLALEQVEMYMRLLKRIIEHIKQFLSKFKSGQGQGFTIDDVNYADIEDDDTSNNETIDEC